MLTNKQELAFFSALGVILLAFLVLSYVIGHSRPDSSVHISAGTPAEVSNVALSAKAAYVLDTLTGTVLYAKNENARLPLASLAKLMSAVVATDIASPWSTVTISPEAVRTEGNAGLVPGEHWSLQSLLDFSLVNSANDGVRAVALSLGDLGSSTASPEAIVNDFVHKMNLKADTLGMKDTYYFNDTGLDEDVVKSGAYGSAKDQAILLEYILKEKPMLLSATREQAFAIFSLDGVKHLAKNTDTILNKIPGVVASKTGYTDLAGGNLIVAFDPELGRPIIISILGSSEEGRFSDMLLLVNASLASIGNSVLLK